MAQVTQITTPRYYFDSGEYEILEDGKYRLNHITLSEYQLQPHSEEPEEFSQLTKQKQARFYHGIPLEEAIQTALKTAKIPFTGNNLDIKHYCHNYGIDIIAENFICEATNFYKTSTMNDNIMNEKIDYYHKEDPEHKKLWILIATYRNCWNHTITKRLHDNNITVIYLNQHVTATKNFINLKTDLIELFKTINNAIRNRLSLSEVKYLLKNEYLTYLTRQINTKLLIPLIMSLNSVKVVDWLRIKIKVLDYHGEHITLGKA